MKTKEQINAEETKMNIEEENKQQQNQPNVEEKILPLISKEKNQQISPQQLQEQAQQFIELFNKFDNEFAYEDNSIYYLLSIKWFEDWKKYVGYEEVKQKTNKHDKFFGLNNPGKFNTDLIEDDEKIIKQYFKNQEEESFYDVILKPFLKNQKDYFIVNKEIMELFIKYYEGFVIPRKAFLDAVGYKSVEVYLKTINALVVTIDILKDVDMRRIQEFTLNKLQICNNMTIQDAKQVLIKSMTSYMKEKQKSSSFQYQYSSLQSNFQVNENLLRLWKLDSSVEIQEAFEYVKKICNSTSGYDYQIQMQGQFLEKDPEMKIMDMGILDKDVFIIEIREDNKSWHFVQDGVAIMEKCDFCYKFGNWKIICGCKTVKYCTDECKQRDSRYHMIRCDKAGESDEENEDFSYKQNSIRGQCGLQNLGNTCFMNSALQCLSNSQVLTEYFINKIYLNEINENNPLGSKGKLAQKYAHLIKNLWIESNSTFSPFGIKAAVAKLNPIFDGYQQHDSSEFLNYLVDGLHEDLNRVKQKPATEYTESNGREDDVVARENWNIFLKRNQSIVVDNFYGMYKSKITCPDCGKISITFDPFLSLPIQIPMKEQKNIEFYFVFKDNNELPVKFSLNFNPKSYTIKDLRADIGNHLDDIDANNIQFYYVSEHSAKKDIQDDYLTTDVKKKIKYQLKLYAIEQVPEQMMIPKDEEITININMEKNVQYYQGTVIKRSFSLVRPFKFSKKDTLQNIHMKVLKHFKQYIIDQADAFGRRKEYLLQMNDERFFEEIYNRMDRPYQLNWVTNSRGYFSCYFCGKTSCENCSIDLSDDPVQGTIEHKLKDVPHYFEVEIDALWDNPPEKFDLNKFNDFQTLEDFLKKKQKENDQMIDEKYTDEQKLLLQFSNQLNIGDKKENEEEEKKMNNEQQQQHGSTGSNQIQHHKKDKNNKAVSIYSCLQQFSEQERLGENNTWYCNKCKDHKQAFKQMQVYIVPKFLIIQLKRFRQISQNSMFQNAKRINTVIDFPLEDFDLTDYILNKNLPQDLADKDILISPSETMELESEKLQQQQIQQGTSAPEQQQQQQNQQIQQKKNSNQKLLYDCYAVSNHYGNVGFGHYTAFARNHLNGQWYEFDDSSVREVENTNKIISQASYLLFYKRKEC